MEFCGSIIMSEIVGVLLDILSFLLAVLSIVFVIITLKQNNKVLKQSSNQFVESLRLESQPFLQMELVDDLSTNSPRYEITIPNENDKVERIYTVCKIKNVGNGTATNLRFTWKAEGKSYSDAFPVNAIMKGDEYFFQVTLEKEIDNDELNIILLWGYEDILGNTYEQKSFLYYEVDKLVCIENDPPTFLGIIGYTKA